MIKNLHQTNEEKKILTQLYNYKND
jgi:hypothetical protein